MIEVTSAATIKRSPEDVFAFVTDLSNLPKWVRGAKAVLVDGRSFEEGALLEQSSQPFGKVVVRIKNYRRDEGFQTQSVRVPLFISMSGAVSLQRVVGGTRFTIAHQFITPFFLRPLDALLTRRAQKESDDAVRALTIAIEGQPANHAGPQF